MLTLNWDVILGPEGRSMLLSGIWITLQLSAYGIVLSTVLGALIAMGRVSRARALAPLRALLTAVVEVFRNVPLLVHLAFWNFGVFGLPWVQQLAEPFESLYSIQFIAAICALVTYRCSYIAEVFRSGLQAVPRGQLEAALSTGLTYPTTMRRVILPQVIRVVFPALGNQYVGLTKNTSVVMVIGVQDLVFQAYQIESLTFQVFLAFGSAMAVFSAICLTESALLNYAAKRLERRWGGGPATGQAPARTTRVLAEVQA